MAGKFTTADERITLHNADCLDVLSTIADDSVDAIITDPPYHQGFTCNGQKGTFEDLNISKPFFKKLFEEYKRVLTPDGSVYFFCDWRGYAFYYPIFDSILGARNLLVWDKGSGMGSWYGYGHELVLFGSNAKYIRTGCGRNIVTGIKSFMNGAKKIEGEKIHPTQKPIELITKFVLDSTDENALVLDTFAGSATTAIAAMRTNRKFIGMELSEQYYNIATNRIRQEACDKEKTIDAK